MEKPAAEILEAFFTNLANLEGMDEEVSQIIQELWKREALDSEELLAALDAARKRADTDVKKED